MATSTGSKTGEKKAKQSNVKAKKELTLNDVYDRIQTLLVAIIFIVIGIEGVANFGGNALYRELSNNADIVVGAVILVSGVFIVFAKFIKGMPRKITKIAALIAIVVWIAYILLSDFVYGFKRMSSQNFFIWLQTVSQNILILICVNKILGVVKVRK